MSEKIGILIQSESSAEARIDLARPIMVSVVMVKVLSMSQMNELKREIREAKKLHLSWRTRLFIFIIGAPTVFLFAVYGRLELAMPLMIVTGMHGLVILFKWKLRRQAWFWIAITVSAALHVPLILFVPWTTRWVPALAITVGATADFFLVLWILLVVGKFMGRPKTEEE